MALGVILLHGLVDDAFYGSRGVLLLFVPFALLAREEQERGRQGDRQRGRGGALISASALALLLALLPATRAVFQANLAALAQTRAELSVYRWPAYPIQDALRRQAPGSPPPVDLAPAIARYRTALALDPGNAAANRRLGQIELSLGQYDAARRHLEAAYATAPGQRATRQLLGETYALAGDPGRAAALWRAVDLSQGQLALREWWYGAIGETANQQRITRAIRQLTTDH
ncbi:MAG: tetratricopeptide repeat protein [Chloroflexi bacterium]|nr:tetratricopeptide repeat protein [Chloroflexota bacterium]